MKLAFSNIAWDIKDDHRVLEYLSKKGFTGLEIAPTKLFGEDPYSCIDKAVQYCSDVQNKYGVSVCSMQSIWYGQSGNIFQSEDDRLKLRDYTFRAVDFAGAIKCKNLVFGNPKARNRNGSSADREVAGFFTEIGRYAHERGTCVALEANPPIYNTDFINTTEEAFDYCSSLKDSHLKVNVDLGTVIYNGEDLSIIADNIGSVNHIHISEPYLKKIEKRLLHKELSQLDYDGYISVEMGQQESVDDVLEIIDYVSEVFLGEN